MNMTGFAGSAPMETRPVRHGGPFSAHLVAFSHLQVSQIRGRQPYLVRKILYVIRPSATLIPKRGLDRPIRAHPPQLHAVRDP
jgi:hypothetical protein